MLKQSRPTTSQALDAVERGLESIDHAQRDRISHTERVVLMERARRVADRMTALAGMLTREVAEHQSTMAATGTPLTSFLSATEQRDSKDAAAEVFGAQDLGKAPLAAEAALAGKVSTRHAVAVGKGMEQLPKGLNADQQIRAQEAFLTRAKKHTPKQLPKLADEVLAEVAPELRPDPADETAKAEAQRKRALRKRSLRYGDDGDGSIWFKGSLPYLEAEPFTKLIDAYVAENRRTTRDQAKAVRDLRPGPRIVREHGSDIRLTREQRQADALTRLVREFRGAPTTAGETPRIVVTMSEESLHQRAEALGVLTEGQTISPGELRRLCCDAAITPVVLGGNSEILDAGNTTRLVTPGLRKALTLRDRGCVFPNCQARDADCEAHHVDPWWNGGTTSLGNLVLLCSHHHAMIEPDRFNERPDQWQIVFGARSRKPIIQPPRRLRPGRVTDADRRKLSVALERL